MHPLLVRSFIIVSYIHMKISSHGGAIRVKQTVFNSVNILYVPPALKSGLKIRSGSSSVQQRRFSWNETYTGEEFREV